MLPQQIVSVLAHTLNGDFPAADREGLEVESARLIGEGRIEVTFSRESKPPVHATFALSEISMPATIRQSEASHGR